MNIISYLIVFIILAILYFGFWGFEIPQNADERLEFTALLQGLGLLVFIFAVFGIGSRGSDRSD